MFKGLMPGAPRQHHFVQEAHIRAFANDAGQLRVYAKDGQTFETSAKRLFSQRDLNSYEGVDGIDTGFEDTVTRAENETFPIIRHIAETGRLDVEDIPALATYMALSLVRNPTLRDGVIEQHRLAVRGATLAKEVRGDFDGMEPFPIWPDLTMPELIDQGKIKIKINNAKYLEAVQTMFERFQNILLQGFRYALLTSLRERVLISDHPVTFVHPGIDFGAYGAPMGGANCELAFPISKRHYVVGFWEREPAESYSEDAVDELNKRQAIFANRQIAAAAHSRAFQDLASRFRHVGFQTRVESMDSPEGVLIIVRRKVLPLLNSPLRKKWNVFEQQIRPLEPLLGREQ